MGKNRKITKKMSVVARATSHIGAIIAVSFIMVILNMLASSSCHQLMKSIGEGRRTLAKLEEERQRQSTMWDRMKIPERIERALLQHGLEMKPARPDQNVQMKSDGTPYPGQLSVARAQRRRAPTAKYRYSRQ